MKLLRAVLISAALLSASDVTTLVQAADRAKVLVILSSSQQLELRDGKSYRTGYYLDELAIPLRKIMDAGYTPVFANPAGNAVTFDPMSNDKMFFGGDDGTRAQTVKFLEGIPELRHPKTFAAILKEGTSNYAGVFVPGGFAPMQDLVKDRSLGDILMTFHANARPTGVLCHGPAALLATVSDPPAFSKGMTSGDYNAASKLAADWPYAGYHLTVFSSAEERAIEGADNQLGGWVQFYVADARAQAGAHLDQVARWEVNVVNDRELVSGQQPFSSDAFGDAFVAKLKAVGQRPAKQ